MFGAAYKGEETEDAGGKKIKVGCAEAFQKALDAAKTTGKGVVLVPKGTYYLEKEVIVPIGVEIIGASKYDSILYPKGIILSQNNKISNLSIKTYKEYLETDKAIDFIKIDSDRMTLENLEHAAGITIKDIYFLGYYPSSDTKMIKRVPANMITLQCSSRDLKESINLSEIYSLGGFRGFYGVTIENIFAERRFNYGIYFKQHYKNRYYSKIGNNHENIITPITYKPISL
jgi:hypothetical protein